MADKKSERRKKMERDLSELRKKGAALEEALQNQRKAKEMEALLIKAKEQEEAKEKEREFASPTNPDEAETGLPPLVKQLGVTMTEQEIMERGTLLQKARLYYTLRDYEGYFGSEESSPDEIKASVIASIKSQEDIAFLRRCAKEFVALQKYGQRMNFYFKRFQTNFAMLARLVNLWDNYEKEAKRLTAIFKEIDRTSPEWREKFIALLNGNYDGEWEGACLRYSVDRNTFSVDVDFKDADTKEGSLYSKIQREAKETEEALADFKAYAMVVQQFLCNDLDTESTLRYMPIAIQMTIENAEEERYTRYLVKNLSFFRSELNYRRTQGETITPEEERRAVIPDFYEVTPPFDMIEDCLGGILEYLE